MTGSPFFLKDVDPPSGLEGQAGCPRLLGAADMASPGQYSVKSRESTSGCPQKEQWQLESEPFLPWVALGVWLASWVFP